LVATEERLYNRDDVIFREGDASESVFIVVSGRVELSKQGVSGPVLLAILNASDIFGETGFLDDVPYGATARASEKSRVKIIPKEDFRAALQNDANAARQAIGMLVERLRAADGLIAGHADLRALSAGDHAGGGRGASPIANFMSWLGRLRFRRRAKPSGSMMQPFIVGVATLNNDIEGGWTRALASLLESRPGIVVRVLAGSLKIEPGADQALTVAAVAKARQVLVREEVVDLLVWGDVHADGYSLWFTAHAVPDDERAGSFSPYFCLELPADQGQPVGDLLYLAVLAAIECQTDNQRAEQYEFLKLAVEALPNLVGGLPVSWNLEQQRTGLTAYGHALATLAALDNGVAWLEKAAEAYHAAIHRLVAQDHERVEPLLRKHLGAVLLALGDRAKSATLLEQAVVEFRHAVECLVKTTFPQEWGNAQNRLGLALYKWDLLTGRSETLKEAITAFQSALQAFPRHEQPLRWGEIMHNMAQVLQVFGDQMKSAEVLERAIETCKASLEFRPRAQMPLAWAAGQNTLGTALFLLAKHRQSVAPLDEAAAAFSGALEVYREIGATRPAAVAEKNLAHLEKLKKLAGVRKVAMPDWADNSR
jgi:CRP-like cAMP-binding protein/tetratricopeptide (TPR) repeat protein